MPPLVYLIYGIPGSGRRELLFDLVEGGLQEDEPAVYFRPEGEARSSSDQHLEALPNLTVVDWRLKDGKLAHGKFTAAPEKIFVLAPGTSDPAEVAEALKAWIDRNGCPLGRILTVVHCAFLSEHPEARAWHEACIHFSDVVVLNRRVDAGNKWVRDFENEFASRRYPCRFTIMKKGRVENPPELLEPEARRLSLFFDELEPIEEDEFEELQPEDRKPDPYIQRLESGQRARPIPDIVKSLPDDFKGA